MPSTTGKLSSREQKKKRENVRALDDKDVAGGNAPFQNTTPNRNGPTKNSSGPSGIGPDLDNQERESFNTLDVQYPGANEYQQLLGTTQATQYTLAGQATLNQMFPAPGTDSWLGRYEHEGSFISTPASNDDTLEHDASVSSSRLIVEAEGRGHLPSKWRGSPQITAVTGTHYGPGPSSTQPGINSRARASTRTAVGRTASSGPSKTLPTRSSTSGIQQQETPQNAAIVQEHDCEPYSPQDTTLITATKHQEDIIPTILTPGAKWHAQHGHIGTASNVRAPFESLGSTESQYDLRDNAQPASVGALEIHANEVNLNVNVSTGTLKSESVKKGRRIAFLEGQIKELRDTVRSEQDAAKAAVERAESTISTLEQRHHEELLKTQQERRESDRRWTRKMAELEADHAREIMRLATKHDEEKGDLRGMYEGQLRNASEEYSRDVDRLKSYILSDYPAISDGDLVIAFERVSQGIINLSRSIQLVSYEVDEALDPTNFLGRSGKQTSTSWCSLVRNVCWVTLCRGFFSYPAGLGALGKDGRGHETLHPYYELCSGQKGGDLHTRTDKETGFSKAWLLGKVRDGVRALNNQTDDQLQFVTLFEQNVESVTRGLVDVLKRVSGGKLEPSRVSEVASLSRQSGLLALDMGSQRAQIVMQYCIHGEWVALGAGFECESRHVAWGWGLERDQVDLMTQPCLKRVGDGHKDFTTEKVIVSGKFVHIKSRSR